MNTINGMQNLGDTCDFKKFISDDLKETYEHFYWFYFQK